MESAQKPTSGQLNDRTTPILTKDRRTDDWVLDVGYWRNSVSSEKGQSELMGSICCTQIPLILVMTGQSHHSPLSGPYSANPQVDPKTHTSTNAVVLFFVMIHTNPPMLMNLCSMFRPFLSHHHVLSHLLFVIMMILLTVSPTLVPLLTHSLLLSIFSYWSVRQPYPQLVGI